MQRTFFKVKNAKGEYLTTDDDGEFYLTTFESKAGLFDSEFHGRLALKNGNIPRPDLYEFVKVEF